MTGEKFRERYSKMSDSDLVNLWREGGLEEEALKALSSELSERNIDIGAEAAALESPKPKKRKKLWVALLLTFLWGPVGLLYISVIGWLTLSLLFILVKVIFYSSFDFGEYMLNGGVLLYFISIPWAYYSVKRYNNKYAGGPPGRADPGCPLRAGNP